MTLEKELKEFHEYHKKVTVGSVDFSGMILITKYVEMCGIFFGSNGDDFTVGMCVCVCVFFLGGSEGWRSWEKDGR